MDHTTLSLITIPLFTGAIGYVTNLSGVWMLFYPVRFAGLQGAGPGAARQRDAARASSRSPGVIQGGLGWQGIVPSRAAKMGSIAVDKGISKLGSPGDFYRQLDPEAIAEQILATARGEIHDVVERIMEREHPQLWHDLPPRVRAAVHARVEEQLPEIVRDDHRRNRHPRRRADRRQADGDPPPRGQPGAGQPDLPRGRPQGAALHRQLRLLLRPAARHPDRLRHRARADRTGGCCRSPAC